MTALGNDIDFHAIADEAIACLNGPSQTSCFSSRPGGLQLRDAYRVTPLLLATFEARGETMVGRKIGFTNRDMWKVYGVESPIWGYITSRTMHDLADVPAIKLAEFSEPRIEPEIMFGLRSAPEAAMSEAELLDCLEWVSLGYEIVQSIFPGWKFAAADTVTANGLHGALLIGKRHAIAPRRAEWQRELSSFEVELRCGDKAMQRGGGSLVLGSPLRALHHLVDVLAADPHNPPLRAGEIISTGTLTLAMPVKSGERWSTTVSGIPLEDVAITFE